MSKFEFSNKFDEQTKVLRSFAFSLTKNEEAAHDLFQETAFRAFSNKEKFKPGTNFRAWLMTIMKNIFINNYRRKKRFNTISDQTNNLYYINSGEDDIFNKGEVDIFMEELMDIIGELPDTLKEPFQLYYEGFKYHEIAEQLDLPLGTVKSRIYFARKELKEKIKHQYSNIYELESRAS
ncbi:RNA polymerase sigma factor [Membranihabitans marinus]|uniref:RNA polymerase sigma factor n=1 Tax=Membranihabitans marinus TaxID=1227546 RepID=UPI001F306C7D|nr:RNA polymerase sigma factor [Membranihabitans marinus]